MPGKPFALLLWLPLLWPDRAAPTPGEVEIVVLDVGQGLSVLVRTANHQLLYDMGPAIPEGFDVNDYGIPEYDEQVLDLQRAFVERFSPGTYLRVDSPHFMEAAIPDQVVEALRQVIGEAGY